MADIFQILCGFAVVFLSIYYYYSSRFGYWKKRGVPGPEPVVFAGNFGPVVLQKVALCEHFKTLYNQYKHEPVFGIYIGVIPTLIINDLELLKDVFVKDFSAFAERGSPMYPKIEPLIEHLFALEPKRWRPLRTRLTPLFSSGKIKDMFPLIIDAAENLKEYLEKVVATGEPVECHELAAKYSTDVIGSCAFGINVNAFAKEDNEFREMGRRIFAPTYKEIARNVLREFSPFLYNIFGRFLQPTGVVDFFLNVVKNTMEYRRKHKIVRPDFINVLMDIKDKPEQLENIELTDSFLASQAFVFFIAGFETSSTTMTHTLYELAQNHMIQDKLRKEIRESCEKYGDALTYEQVNGMTYLDKVFKETLRKYPLLGILTRQATEDYTFKGTKVTIEKGTKVGVLVYPMQLDSDLYPKPEVFDPERFNEDAVAARHPMSYMPFGNGPRHCIAARFAYYQGKIGLITILRNYKIDVCEKTVIPYKSEPRLFLLTLKGGTYLKITKV